MSEFAALVLAGGRANRLGGVDKPALTLDGESLVARAVKAARAADADPIVVVGPERPGVEAVWARENPPFGGPVAALAAGLPLVLAEWALVLAADLRRPHDIVRALVDAPRAEDGAHLVDADGHAQWLCGLYRTEALRAQVSSLEAVTGASMRALLAPLRLAKHPISDDIVADVDTPADARDAGITL